MGAASGRLALRTWTRGAVEDRRQVARLLDRGVQALLVAPGTTGSAGRDLPRRPGGPRVPVVPVERMPPPEPPTTGLDAGVTDHALGAGPAVRHLASPGHRAVGLVLSRPSPHREVVPEGWSAAVSSPDLSVGRPGAADPLDRPVHRVGAVAEPGRARVLRRPATAPGAGRTDPAR
ncbi:hypothetical protein ACIGNX_18095 [Actinosynnema sp. NPDC053489]|uniref:hypothetical protein n=1 Tax=Actinosynnema sp. NPDC053489 TaxID=3363916 RepID=UPI0037C98B50